MYYSDEGDEIVECDNCGITVHEGNNPLLSLLFPCAPGHNLNTRGWKVDKSLSMVNWYSQNELPIKWFPHNYIKVVRGKALWGQGESCNCFYKKCWKRSLKMSFFTFLIFWLQKCHLWKNFVNEWKGCLWREFG